MKRVTLLFLLRPGEILLAMKKRGTGQGKWNGVGGKIEGDESVEAATIRECQEEVGVTPHDLEKVGVIDFRIPHLDFHNVAHVYFCRTWDGEPEETEEMAPEWFRLDNVPYDQMWSDDRLWMPRVLNGDKIEAHFVFNEREQVVRSVIRPLRDN